MLEQNHITPASAGAQKRMACQKGKFQGIMPSKTPIGTNSTYAFFAYVSATSGSKNPPVFWAKYSNAKSHFSISGTDSLITLPISMVMILPSSFFLLLRTFAALLRYCALPDTSRFFHSIKAVPAFLIAMFILDAE